MFQRVFPRDLFNESKLLKCFGQLSLHLHNGIDGERQTTPPVMELRYDDCPLVLCQHEDGGLYYDNLYAVVATAEEKRLDLRSEYNSRDPYPLTLMTDDYEEIPVFDNTGSFTEEFLRHIYSL